MNRSLLLFLLSAIRLASFAAIDGGWSLWGSWTSACSELCGNGVHKRWRYCDTPTPLDGGLYCSGVNYETKPCYLRSCSGLTLANVGESCQKHCSNIGTTCDAMISTGNRVESFTSLGVSCELIVKPLWSKSYHPAYESSRQQCDGYLSTPAEISCSNLPPPGYQRLCTCIHQDDVGFSQWSCWTSCSQLCNSGSQTRSRDCQNTPCSGADYEQRNCNEIVCPVNGDFSDWTIWTTCTDTCGGGTQNRFRSCINPTPRFDGKPCFNPPQESRKCNVESCPRDGEWNEWTSWNSCPVCNDPINGRQHLRYRTCSNPAPLYGGMDCSGLDTDTKPCADILIDEICPPTLLHFKAILPDAVWINELLYPPNVHTDEIEESIRSNILTGFGESPSWLINSSVHQVTANLFELTPDDQVLVYFDVLFNALNHHEYVYLLEALVFRGSFEKLNIHPSYGISINGSLLANISMFGTAPNEKPVITDISSSDSTSFHITWSHLNQSNFDIQINGTNQTYGGYYLYFRMKDVDNYPYESRSVLCVTNNTIIDGLNFGTVYIVWLTPYNAWGNGIPSDFIEIKTMPTLPSLPLILPFFSITDMEPGRIFIEWGEVPLENMNGFPVSYNFYITRQETGEIILKKIPYTARRNLEITLLPSNLYLIQLYPENEVGEGVDMLKVMWETVANAPLWNAFNIEVLPRPAPNSIRIIWDTIPVNLYLGDLIGYHIEYTLTKYGHKDLQISIKKSIDVPQTQHELVINDLIYSGHYRITVQAINQYGSGPVSKIAYTKNCVCPSVLSSNYFFDKPYLFRKEDGELTGFFNDMMSRLIDLSCGDCEVNDQVFRSKIDWAYNGKGYWAEKSTFKETRDDISFKTHLSFPFLFNNDVTSYMQGTFIPVINYPGIFFLIMAPAADDFVNRQVSQVISVVPMAIPMTLFVFISGIILWFCERGKNPKQYSERFTIGAFQGAYWSYATMTTVGYGDKHAVTFCGRLFAILWIVASMIIIGIFVGSVTDVVMGTERTKFDAKIEGSKISVIKGTYEYFYAVQKRAKIRRDFIFTDYDLMSASLETRQVTGILVNVYEAARFMKLFNKKNMVVKELIDIPKSYGFVLSKELSPSKDYFHETIKAEATNIILAFNVYMGNLKVNYPKDEAMLTLISLEAPQMIAAIVSLISMLIIFTLLGFLIWHYGFRKWKHNHARIGTRNRQKVNRDTLREATDLVEKFKENIEKKLRKLEYKHMNQRIKHWKNMKPGVIDSVRPRNYDMRTVSMNGPFITS